VRSVNGPLAYTSKTVRDGHTATVKGEWEVVCAISNGDVADELEWP